MLYYLGPWLWDSGESPCWRPPSGVVGSVDLAASADMTLPGSDRGLGFFASPAPLPSEYALLGDGDCRELPFGSEMQSAWKSLTGYAPQGETLVDLLWDHLTNGSDPEGNAACKPLFPTTRGLLELHLGGHSLVKSEKFTWGQPLASGTDLTGKIQEVLQADFRQLFEAAAAGKLNDDKQHLRVLDYWCEKYKIADFQQFVPADLQSEVTKTEPHKTTITEDFTHSNSTTVMGNLLTWTQVTGTWGTLSNQGYKTATYGAEECVRAESDLSSADHYAQCATKGAFHTGVGPCARFNASATTFYRTRNQIPAGAGNLLADKVVTGTGTNLASTANTAGNQTLKIELNGSTLKCYVDGSEKISLTDTAITTNLRTGMASYYSTYTPFDDFEAADLAAAATAVPVFMAQYRQRWG